MELRSAATHTSAGTFIGTIGVMYTVGWSFGWLVLSIPLAYWFIAAVLAPRFTRVRMLTLPAFLESPVLQQGDPRAFGGHHPGGNGGVHPGPDRGRGPYRQHRLRYPVRWGMVGFTAILLAYTVIGGMIAVVYTDFVQLVIMILGVVLAVPLAIRQVGGVDDLFTYVQAVNPLTFTWEGLPGTLLFTMGLAFMLGSVATPEKLIRLYAMKDMPTIRRGILFAILVITGVNLLVFILSLASVILFPVLPTGDLAMPMIARAVLPPTLGALMLAAITSAMMSTVDSLLIVAGSALSYDLFQNLVHPGATERQKVMVDRIGILVVGCIPVLLLLTGVGEGELVQFIVLLFTALMASAFFMPVVLGVYWRRGTREGAAAAMIGGVAATFLWKGFGSETIDPVLPGFLVSAFLMVAVSLLTTPPPQEALDPYFPRKG